MMLFAIYWPGSEITQISTLKERKEKEIPYADLGRLGVKSRAQGYL